MTKLVKSKDLKNLIDGPAGDAMAVGYGCDAVQPSVLLGRGFVVWRRAHVVFRGADILPASDAVQDVFRPVTHAEIGHSDQSPVVSLHHETHIQSNRSVCPQGLPIAAAGKNSAAKSLAFEAAADDLTDASVVAGSGADN